MPDVVLPRTPEARRQEDGSDACRPAAPLSAYSGRRYGVSLTRHHDEQVPPRPLTESDAEREPVEAEVAEVLGRLKR